MAEWTSSSNETFNLTFVDVNNDGQVHDVHPSFKPQFSYPIFGEEEKIYGYKGLNIDLRFAAGSLRQYLAITHSEKLPAATADNVDEKLSEFLPSDVIRDEGAFISQVKKDSSFKPMGTKIHSFIHPSPNDSDASTSDGRTPAEYEVYHTTWETPGFREFHRRMQLFIVLYIEGGSYIHEDEETWEFMVLFEKKKRGSSDEPAYHFVGYSSLYPFYCYPERVRLRLSQFVIIPPYQRRGLGSALYNSIYNYVLKNDHVSELTVEDPAEAFEDLRDRNDLRMLLNLHTFIDEGFGIGSEGGPVRNKGKGAASRGKMGPPVERAWAEKWRVKLKIAGRQFHRLVEMIILLRLDPADARAQKAYRLQVKERLYRFNYEILMQLDKEERFAKLEETFRNVCDDYKRILAMAL